MAEVTSKSELVAALADEFAERFRRGERPPISEYVRRCPEAELEIREVLSALAHVERLAPSPQEEGALHEPHATELPHLHQLGDFRIIREVGRGGMGVVYEAEQVSLGRRVALKVLPRQTLLDSKHAKRFEREARAAAKLHHTNIVPVFGVGQQEGLHYYVMQFIHGLGLDEVLVELKRLREASEFPHATAEQQIASVVAAGAAEKAAVGVQALACGGQPEGGTPTGRGVSALDVAQSLVSGQFERTLIFDSGEESDVSGQPSGSSTPTLPATTLHSPHATLHIPPDTTVGRLSETAAGSGTYALPGQSEAHRKAHSRGVYWQSVARIGVQAAEALQYAHDQGVIHRDVKPGNLLLDTRGSVWVTDFGLAKATDQQDLTHTGDVLGTLRYMAPEQFDGKADARSDVYALGLTLYELLALQPGFGEKDRHRLIKQVTNGAPARLRTVDAHIPRDLEIIVHKAIEREPAQRYQTAGELAADLQRYLGDEPIRARRISPVTRFARWCKRNPAVASLTTTIALLLVAAVAISSIAAVEFEGLAADNGRLAAQAIADKHTAVAAQNEAEAARDRERELRDEADAQKLLAQANFARALEAVNTYLDEITDTELLSVPGLQPLRRELLAAALTFYTEFTLERTDDPKLLIELAGAHYRLGRIQHDLGNSAAAATANNESIRLFEDLRKRDQANIELQHGLAEAYYWAKRFDDTIQLCQAILERHPTHAEVSSLLAETYNSLAVDKEHPVDIATALNYHQQAFALRDVLARDNPHNAGYQAQLGATLNNLGVLLGNQKKNPEALAMFERAVPYSARACEMQPHSVLWGEWLCNGVRNCAYKQVSAGLSDEALQSFERLVAVRRRIVFQNPAITHLRGELYKAHLDLGRHQQRIGQDATLAFRRARDVLENIPRETPDDLFELATVYAVLARPVDDGSASTEGDLETTAEDLRAQKDNADRAVQALQAAFKAGFASAQGIETNKDFEVLRERDDFQALVERIEQAAAAAKALANAGKGSGGGQLPDLIEATEHLKGLDEQHHRQTLAATVHSIGVIQTGLKQFEEAEKSLNEALELRQDLLSERDDDPQARLDVLATRAALGQLRWSDARYPEAHQMWQQCLDESRELADARPDDAAFQQQVAVVEREICHRYGQQGLWELSSSFARNNVRLRRVADRMRDPWFSVSLRPSGETGAFIEYGAFLKERLLGEARQHPWTLAGVVWWNCLSETSGVPAETLIATAREAVAAQPDTPWLSFTLAMALFRGGQYEEALQTLGAHAWGRGDAATSDAFLWQSSAYLRAMLYQALQHPEDAQRAFDAAETAYRAYCRRAINSTGTEFPHLVHTDWWWLVYPQQLRLEALRKLRGDEHADDPWQHLIQARGYRLIGEIDKADQELAAAEAAASDDPDVWLARARLLDQWDANEENWRGVIELAGDDPLVWIERGRAYAERGEHESAEDAFSRAARLTDSLNSFLEGGWRAVGPITPEMAPGRNRDALVLSASTDRTQPVVVLGDTNPLEWKPLPPEPHGYIAIDPEDAARLGAWYTAANVYCRNPREADLLLAGTGKVIIWVNGEQVVPETSLVGAEFPAQVRQTVRLESGRNTILVRLVRTAGKRSVFIRFPESPLDRAIDFAEAGLFADAVELLETGLQTPPFSEQPWEVYAAALRAEGGDEQRYRSLCERIVDRYGDTTHPPAASVVALVAGMTPEQVVPPARLVELAELQLSLKPSDPARVHLLGLALYRAERCADAKTRLQNDIDVERFPQCWPLLAMTLDRLGDREAAGARLARAHEWYSETLDGLAAGDSAKPADWEPFVALLREAAQQIEGKPLANDHRLHLWRARSWSGFGEFERALGELDAALALAPGDSGIAMARARLLDQWDATEENWRPVLELAGDVRLVWIERGRAYAERGELEKAENDFARAISPGADGRPPMAVAPFTMEQSNSYQTAWAAYLGVPVQFENSLGMKFRLIPPGVFQMGTAENDRANLVDQFTREGLDDRRLQEVREEGFVKVFLSEAVYAGQFEVTVAQFRSFVDQTGYETDAERSGVGGFAFRNGWQRHPSHNWKTPSENWILNDQQPVVHVSWNDAVAFCEWLSEIEKRVYTLPTEAQWEFACRAGSSSLYGGSDDPAVLEATAWTRENTMAAGVHQAQDVGTKAPNSFGLHDLLGNALELCLDGYAPGISSEIPILDPLHSNSNIHVGRGGAWYRQRVSARCGARTHHGGVRTVDAGSGFRVWLKIDRRNPVVAAGTGDAAALMARARLLERWEDLAEAAWERAVELAGDDPLPRIHFGRWYAERGEHAKADALFAEAASLTPDELNKFLEAGWWVVGPYPPILDEFCPPEIDPDPSRPVYVIDPQTGLSDEPVSWQHAPTGRLGTFRMTDALSGSDGSAYALAYVYSPVECTRLLRVGVVGEIRIWCNGQLVWAVKAHARNQVQASRVPVTLQPGRNEILVRAGLDAPVSLRVADTPADRFLTFAEQGLWKEAVEAAFVDGRTAFGEPIGDQGYFASVEMALLSGDEHVVDREDDRLLQMALRDSNPWNQLRAAGTLVLADNPLAREHAADLEAVLVGLLPTASTNFPQQREILAALAANAVLLGDTEHARQYLLQVEGKPQVTRFGVPTWAIINECAGQHDEAVAALERGLQEAADWQATYNWPSSVRYFARLREAERQITGSTARIDEILATRRQTALADWDGRDPATATFDHLIATYAITGTPITGPAYPWLARGRRLAELGRFDEAEADFNRAVQLAPDAPDVFTARAAFHAQRGNSEAAAADRAAAARVQTAPPALSPLSRNALLALAERLAGEEQWSAAARVYRWLHQRLPHELQIHRDLACCELMEHGPDAYRTHCRAIIEQVDASDDVQHKRLTVWTCLLIPDAVEDTTVLLDLAREVAAAAPDPLLFSRKVLAGALFRSGHIDEAIPVMHEIETDKSDKVRGQVLFLLAMAHHARGEEETARSWLQQGDLWTGQAIAAGELKTWIHACSVQVWQQEAHQRLGVPLNVPHTDGESPDRTN